MLRDYADVSPLIFVIFDLRIYLLDFLKAVADGSNQEPSQLVKVNRDCGALFARLFLLGVRLTAKTSKTAVSGTLLHFVDIFDRQLLLLGV